MTNYREAAKNFEQLKGEQVAGFVEEVLENYPFEITQHLIDSNVVLTLAGMKGQTEFYLDEPDPEQERVLIERIGDLSCDLCRISPYLFMRVAGVFVSASDNKRTIMTEVINLEALEEWVLKTKFRNLPPFDKSEGLEGYDNWRTMILQKYGDESVESEVATGVRRGYPDQAIADFIHWYKTGCEKDMLGAEILYAGIYQEAGPIYSFYPESASDPEIVDNVKKSSAVLEGFYESRWHKAAAKRFAFKKT